MAEGVRDAMDTRLQAVLDGAAIGIAVVSPDGRIVDGNLGLRTMLGYRPEEIQHASLQDLSHPEDVDSEPRLFDKLVSGRCDRYELEKRYVRKDGQLVWCHVTGSLAHQKGDERPVVVLTFEDVTERKWMADALEEKEKQLRAVIDQTRDGIFVGTPQGSVIVYNSAMEKISGYTMVEANERGWFDLTCRDPMKKTAVVEIAVRAVSGKSETVEVPIVRKDGETAWVQMSMSPISAGGQQFALGVVTDITKGKQQEERLTYLATHDGLTGLPNRLIVEMEVEKELAGARIKGPRSALMFLDLDGFKLVNDMLGHSTGDQVLIDVTRIIGRELRSEDLLMRQGGDEFAVLLPETGMSGAMVVADRLRQVVDEYRPSLDDYDYSLHLGLSIGIVQIGGQPDVEAVISQADAAMYHAKAYGGNRVEAYQSKWNQTDQAYGLKAG